MNSLRLQLGLLAAGLLLATTAMSPARAAIAPDETSVAASTFEQGIVLARKGDDDFVGHVRHKPHKGGKDDKNKHDDKGGKGKGKDDKAKDDKGRKGKGKDDNGKDDKGRGKDDRGKDDKGGKGRGGKDDGPGHR